MCWPGGAVAVIKDVAKVSLFGGWHWEQCHGCGMMYSHECFSSSKLEIINGKN